MIYEIVVLFIGWLYPAFATFDAFDADHATQRTWMKYWIVMGLFSSFHFFTSSLDAWVPCLSGFKLFVLCWLIPTLGAGSQLIYDDFVDPLLRRNKALITSGVNNISYVACSILREFIKMIYHLSVDVVEQCWLVTRNADDIHVTPRLQAAINDVIAELRVAQRAATMGPSITGQLQGATESESSVGMKILKFTSSNLTDDDVQLNIMQAEAESALRMQRSVLSANREHLAPINCNGIAFISPNPNDNGNEDSEPMPNLSTDMDVDTEHPIPPKHSKRNATRLDQLEMDTSQAYCEHAVICDYDSHDTLHE